MLSFGVLFLGLSCSLSRYEYIPCQKTQECQDAFDVESVCNNGFCEPLSCEVNQECQDAFGFGSVCTNGACDSAQTNSRCKALFPSDIFDNTAAYANAHPIGVLFDNTSDVEKIAAAELAIDEIRSRGTLAGQEIIAIQCNYEDDLVGEFGDGLIGQDAVQFGAEYLSDDLNIPLIIGPAGSDDCIAAYDVVKNTDTVLISPSATSEALSIIDGIEKSDENPGLFWRTVGSDKIQATVLSNYISQQLAEDEVSPLYSHIAVVNQKSSYGEGFANTMLEYFEESPLITTYRYPFDNVSEEAWLEVGNNSLITAVVFISSDVLDIIEFINDIDTRSNYENIDIFLPDAAAKDLLLTNTASVSADTYARIRGSRPAIPSGVVFNNFEASYEAYTGEEASESVFSAFSYDATWIGVYGLIWAQFQGDPKSGKSIAQGLRKLSASEGMAVDINLSSWTTVIANFEAGQSINISGASGLLDFEPTTEETSNNIEIWSISASGEGGQFLVVQTCDSDGNCE